MKLPWIQFYPGDWLKDPRLSLCTPETRGVWIDLLMCMHELDRVGELSGTSEQLARAGRCSPVQLAHALTDLQTTGAADVTQRNDIVTVINRRMSREHKQRQGNTMRQQRLRCHADSNASVTPYISEVIGQKSEKVHTRSVDCKPVGGSASALQECVNELVQKKSVQTNGIMQLRSLLCVMYKRPETAPWDNFEEHLLVDVAKRPDWQGELETIKEFRFKLTSKRFFPQKLARLLEEWNGTLDRARRAKTSPSLYSTI